MDKYTALGMMIYSIALATTVGVFPFTGWDYKILSWTVNGTCFVLFVISWIWYFRKLPTKGG